MVRPGAAARRSRPKAGVRLIIWCRDCRHQVEPDPAEQAQRYGAETTLPDWRERLVCSRCGSPETDMVLTGIKRRAGVINLLAGTRVISPSWPLGKLFP